MAQSLTHGAGFRWLIFQPGRRQLIHQERLQQPRISQLAVQAPGDARMGEQWAGVAIGAQPTAADNAK